MKPSIECVVRTPDVLGESPLWYPEERALYWIDIDGRRVRSWQAGSGALRSWAVAERPGSIAFRRGGGLIAGLASGFAFLHLGPADAPARIEALYDPEPGQPEARLNDGRCDPAGRFWAGSINEARVWGDLALPPISALYRFGADRRCATMVEGLRCSNGLAFSPDAKTLYHVEYFADESVVFAYDFDVTEGVVSGKRRFASEPNAGGIFDGAATDTEGCYWSVRLGTGRVVRHDPGGREIATIALPVTMPTMCSFGGDDLKTLFVTTATLGKRASELAGEPLAGCLFAIEGTGAQGLPEPRYAG